MYHLQTSRGSILERDTLLGLSRCYLVLSFSEGQKYPGVAPGYFLCGMTPHGCDTRGKKCQTGGIPGAKNTFGVTFPAKKSHQCHFFALARITNKVSTWLQVWYNSPGQWFRSHLQCCDPSKGQVVIYLPVV